MPEEKTASAIIKSLRALADPSARRDMERFGIFVDNALGGISTPDLKKLAHQIGKNHILADELWKSGIHEARHLAALIE